MAEPDVDLDAIAADLDDVERALTRLDDGTYWTDEASGAPLDDELLARSPVARTAAPAPPRSPVAPAATPPSGADSSTPVVDPLPAGDTAASPSDTASNSI